MIADNLPALLIAIPLFAAPLCVFIGSARMAWALAQLVSVICLLLSGGLILQLQLGKPLQYLLGGWEPPIGIEYQIDPANALVLFIVSLISALILPFAYRSVELEVAKERHHLFYSLYLLCQTGLMGIAITGDAFNIFVFLEISSLASYALIALGQNRKALTAAFTYLIMGTIGATFILIGIGLIYMMTGTLNMADMHDRLPSVTGTRPVLAAFAFITVGVALKLALFPLHLWLPNAYAYAPSAVTAFIAATATKVSIYVLLRFTFTIFGNEFAFQEIPLATVLAVPAVAAMFIGSLVAIFQENLKRMLAYSSVAQIGYIILAVSLASEAGLTAGLVHIFNHAIIKAALFCTLGCVFYRMASVELSDMGGLAKEMPWTFACFIIGSFSLMGIPGTAGFISKWYLVQAVLEMNLWWLAVMILASSLLAVIYVARVVEVMYFKDRPPGRAAVGEAPLSMLIPTGLLSLANIYFGLDTSISVTLSSQAAKALLGGTW